MKDKQFEYKQLSRFLLQPQKNLDSKDIDIYSSIFQLGKIGRILVYFVGLIIGFIACVVFNISFWWIILFVFGIAEIIGLYVAIREGIYSSKLSSKIEQQEALRKICNVATDFTVIIELNAVELAKHNKKIDLKKVKHYENIIGLNKVDNGWELSGTKPLYLQNDLTKEPELVIVRADHEFIKNNDYQTIIFSLPETKSKKQINRKFSLFVSEDYIKFYKEHVGDSAFGSRRKDDVYDVEHINISLRDLRLRIFERIVNAFQPYNDDVNVTESYWSKKYLFKSDEYRNKKLNECLEKRQDYESSQQFRKIKFGPFGEEKAYPSTAFGVTIDEKPDPKQKVKYSHTYRTDFLGATHVFETESFKITIIQY